MLEWIVTALVVCMIGFLIYSFATKKGRNAMRKLAFGGEILRSWDGVKFKRKIVTQEIVIHAVGITPNLRMVGIEINASSGASPQVARLTLPRREALALAEMLVEAAEYKHTVRTSAF